MIETEKHVDGHSWWAVFELNESYLSAAKYIVAQGRFVVIFDLRMQTDDRGF